MKNKIEDLRNILFDQLGKLQEAEDDKIDVECTRTTHMVQIAESIIDSARAENEFLQITSGTGSGFIPVDENQRRKITEGVEKKS